MSAKKNSLLAIATIIFGSHLPALAGDSKVGVWKQSGYRIEADGKPIPCENGPCLKLQGGPDLSKLCVPANALRSYAEQHLQQIAQVMTMRFHNCKEISVSSTTHEEHKLQCDEAVVSQSVEQPDISHLTYKTIVEGTQAQPGRMESGATFEWIGDDCTGVNGVIK